ncbi:MAG: hypothetical protein ACD_20C00095G0018 [uncultured bacterium]|nr:MAG: hypothetical protein ACD_20C00095G0018 [uncultured bacterium]HBH19274.1 SulP family inorganic anion transporter [Cyanobacteria bacterium UBA9579]
MQKVLESSKKIFINLKGDLFGGVTAGVIALPLALAFGVASGVGAAAGLYGAIIVGLFAAMFGGTKPQISGPTGPITVVVAAIVATNPGNIKLIFLTIFLAGIFQIILGISSVGKLIKYVPYPVISGFMSGIGVIIIMLQINPLLGFDVQGTPIKTILNLGQSLHSVEFQSLLIGLLTLFIVFFTPARIRLIVPPALIALVSVTFISVILGLNIKTIGEIPTTIPNINLTFVSIKELAEIIPIAITIAVLGSIDSLLTSLVSDSLTKERHDSNKELIGQGIGNAIAGIFGGLAGAGATMRTVINIKSGGKTKLSGVIHSIFLITILLGLAPLAELIPMAVLAGILIKVGFDIIDYKFIKVLRDAPQHDLWVMMLVFAITVFGDLIFAVGAGIVLSSLLFAVNIANQTNVTIEEVDDKETSRSEHSIENRSAFKIRVVDIEGVFFFGSCSRILTRVDDLLGTQYLILNCKSITNMDISAIFALENIIVRMKDNGITVMLIVNNKNITINLLKLGVLKLISRENIFYSKLDAIKKAQLYIDQKITHQQEESKAESLHQEMPIEREISKI